MEEQSKICADNYKQQDGIQDLQILKKLPNDIIMFNFHFHLVKMCNGELRKKLEAATQQMKMCD